MLEKFKSIWDKISNIIEKKIDKNPFGKEKSYKHQDKVLQRWNDKRLLGNKEKEVEPKWVTPVIVRLN